MALYVHKQTKTMRHLSKLGLWILVLLPALMWAIPIPVTDGLELTPNIVAAKWDGGYTGIADVTLPFTWAPALPGSFELDLVSSATMAQSTGTSNTSVLGDSEPQRSLALCIMIMLMLGTFVKYFGSPRFYDVLSDVCFTLSAIEQEDRETASHESDVPRPHGWANSYSADTKLLRP
ncbi:MAG TPA: hypothetical protein VGH38_37270 [Bryobacteraceae bacterium]